MDYLFRRISRIAIVVAMLLPVMGIVGTSSARADTMTWQLRSFSKNAVEVKFFSSNRRVVWPTATTHYDIKDYNTGLLRSRRQWQPETLLGPEHGRQEGLYRLLLHLQGQHHHQSAQSQRAVMQ
jgi:hypothetical protein